MNKKIIKIVLTGGPCGGKTTAIELVKSHLTKNNYTVLTVSEVASDLIGGGVSPLSCGTNKDFQEAQVALQIAKELAYEKASESMGERDIVILCDRGVMDNRAYMTEGEFSDIVGSLGYSIDNLMNSYSAVFHMETADAASYTTANNSARSESHESAILLDKNLRKAWNSHKHFYLIENQESFQKKLDSLICAIDSHLDMLNSVPAISSGKRTVLAIGRWMPIHKGHKAFLVKLANEFDKLVVGIGSCYDNGSARNCIPAIEREILLRRIFRSEGIPDEKITIVPISDKETFEEWINDVIEVCEKHSVTHFCTGNKEDILNVLEKMNISLGLEMINPEESSEIPYHATDVRNAILAGDDEKMNEMLPAEVIDLVKAQVKREVIAASCGQGREFIPGKQTVDIVFICNENDGEKYILLGNRSPYKRDFPGTPALPGSGICDYESAIDAALRVLRLETGINCSVTDRCNLPLTLKLENGIDALGEMHFVNLFSSSDMAVNGTMGGASQCFAVTFNISHSELEKCLYSRHDLSNLHFVNIKELPDIQPAYEQKSMIYEAFDALMIPAPEERFDELLENGALTGKKITRKEAHQRGVLHGASHVCIYRKNKGKTELLMQKRSDIKDSFPSCYDISSAGHIESGSDFLDTAKKELFEELGISLPDEALKVLFDTRISDVERFHGDIFHNEELCRVYAAELDIDPQTLTLQEVEISRADWFELSYLKEQFKKGNPLFCTDKDEFAKIANAIENI